MMISNKSEAMGDKKAKPEIRVGKLRLNGRSALMVTPADTTHPDRKF